MAAATRATLDWAYVAGVHAALGDLDSAFEALEAGYERRDAYLLMMEFVPILDPLRDDPRFADLVRRVDENRL